MDEGHITILVVEDEKSHALAITRIFNAVVPNAKILLAGSLDEYRRIVEVVLPDVVVIDLNLPDGRATEILTSPAENGAFPVLIMTAHGNEEMAVTAMKAGALDYIVKSAEAFACLPQTVERALREWKLLQKNLLTEKSLQESETRFSRLLQDIPTVAVQGYGIDGTVHYWNLASEILYGYTAVEAIGRNLLDLIIPPDVREDVKNALQWMVETGQAIPASEMKLMRKDGTLVAVFSSHAVVQKPGAPLELFCLDIDITERKQNEEQLEFLATHDELTGLANRALLQDRLAQSLRYAHRSGRILAVLLIDLDRFKIINDSLGHDFGDKLLGSVAVRLQQVVREADTVARLGGDEFVVLLSEVADPDDVGVLATRILRNLAEPHRIDGREITVIASLGISLYPKDSDNGATLIRNADIAMYRAKREGGGSFSFFAPEMNQRAIETMELENALRQALERDEFCLYYQPKVDLASGRITGCEALARWQHPQRGVVSPNDFIPLAEETGLIVPLGTWVLQEACRQAKAWQDQGLPGVSAAVNLSARQFRKGDLPQLVQEILQKTGLDPCWLELEMTESMVMDDPDKAIAIMDKLKHIGARLSLDDFGTGYSSFSSLSRFPIDHLKIDRSFVTDIVTNPNSATIATSIIAMAHRMRLKVIAEGVETEAQLGYLRKHDCDEVQGFFFSRPLPADEFAAFLKKGIHFPVAEVNAYNEERTLMIVDDEPNIILALRRVLFDEGYRILSAGNAHEGLELLARENIQVVLSDQRMPGMTGAEFLGRVKVLHPATVRIVLSGYADLETVTRAVNEGAVYRFLDKSWDDDLLRGDIRDAFRNYEEIIRPRQERGSGS
ncbi:MAG: EAL domain-containing protein [Desulfuromonadales bacterium]|nr:EAL domain-containing protein [Desulfuromonadales bacterium]